MEYVIEYVADWSGISLRRERIRLPDHRGDDVQS